MPNSEIQLTERQRAIIAGLEQHKPLKDIAPLVGVSESYLNKQIVQLKSVLGARNRHEIIAKYHALSKAMEGRKTTRSFSTLSPDSPATAEEPANEAGQLHFADAGMSASRPWANVFEPRIVPRWLDGERFVLARIGVMLGLLLLMLALPVLGVAAIDSITDILRTISPSS